MTILKKGQRFISIGLIAVFVLTEAMPAWALSELVSDPARLQIESEFARVKSFHRGMNGKLILHIQDAHTNLSGQENLAKTLDAIVTRYGVNLVLVEGGSEDDTLTELKGTASSAAWKIIAKKHLIKGNLAGEEYLNLTTEHPLRLLGIEDKALYQKSVAYYAHLTRQRESALAYLDQISYAIKKIKMRLYPREILDYESAAESRRVERLAKWSQMDRDTRDLYPQLARIFEPVAAVQEAYSPQEVEALLNESVLVENSHYETYLSTQDARRLREADRFVDLLYKAYRIQMSSDDFKACQSMEKDFARGKLEGFVNRKLVELGYAGDLIEFSRVLDRGRGAVTDFYESVSERDVAFVRNTEKAMASETMAVLISGGYHTEHLTQLLKERGYSYAVLTPIITSETNQKRYEDLLLSQIEKASPIFSPRAGKVTEGVRLAALKESPARLAAVMVDVPSQLAPKMHAIQSSGARLSSKNKQVEMTELDPEEYLSSLPEGLKPSRVPWKIIQIKTLEGVSDGFEALVAIYGTMDSEDNSQDGDLVIADAPIEWVETKDTEEYQSHLKELRNVPMTAMILDETRRGVSFLDGAAVKIIAKPGANKTRVLKAFTDILVSREIVGQHLVLAPGPGLDSKDMDDIFKTAAYSHLGYLRHSQGVSFFEWPSLAWLGLKMKLHDWLGLPFPRLPRTMVVRPAVGVSIEYGGIARYMRTLGDGTASALIALSRSDYVRNKYFPENTGNLNVAFYGYTDKSAAITTSLLDGHSSNAGLKISALIDEETGLNLIGKQEGATVRSDVLRSMNAQIFSGQYRKKTFSSPRRKKRLLAGDILVVDTVMGQFGLGQAKKFQGKIVVEASVGALTRDAISYLESQQVLVVPYSTVNIARASLSREEIMNDALRVHSDDVGGPQLSDQITERTLSNMQMILERLASSKSPDETFSSAVVETNDRMTARSQELIEPLLNDQSPDSRKSKEIAPLEARISQLTDLGVDYFLAVKIAVHEQVYAEYFVAGTQNLFEKLNSPNPQERRTAAYRLGSIPTDLYPDELFKNTVITRLGDRLLKDPYYRVRAQSARALGRLGGETAIDFLKKAYFRADEPESLVREWVIQSLRENGVNFGKEIRENEESDQMDWDKHVWSQLYERKSSPLAISLVGYPAAEKLDQAGFSQLAKGQFKLGMMYVYQGEMEEAIPHLDRAIQYFNLSREEEGILPITTTLNIATVYMDMAEADHSREGKRARMYQKKAQETLRSLLFQNSENLWTNDAAIVMRKTILLRYFEVMGMSYSRALSLAGQMEETIRQITEEVKRLSNADGRGHVGKKSKDPEKVRKSVEYQTLQVISKKTKNLKQLLLNYRVSDIYAEALIRAIFGVEKKSDTIMLLGDSLDAPDSKPSGARMAHSDDSIFLPRHLKKALKREVPAREIIGLATIADTLSPSELFLDNNPIVLEIGVSDGLVLLDDAKKNPDLNYIGIDLPRFLKIDKNDIPKNVRWVSGDSRELLSKLRPMTIHEIRYVFPNPSPNFRETALASGDSSKDIDQMTALLKPGGRIIIVTEHDQYAASLKRDMDRVGAGGHGIVLHEKIYAGDLSHRLGFSIQRSELFSEVRPYLMRRDLDGGNDVYVLEYQSPGRVLSISGEDFTGGDSTGFFSNDMTRSLGGHGLVQGVPANLNVSADEVLRKKEEYFKRTDEIIDKLFAEFPEMRESRNEVTRIVYPATGYDYETLVSLLRLFPNVKEVVVVDSKWGGTSAPYRNPERDWKDSLFKRCKGVDLNRTPSDLSVTWLANDYYEVTEKEVSRLSDRQVTVFVEKAPGHDGSMRDDPRFRKKMLSQANPGDFIFALPATKKELSPVLSWDEDDHSASQQSLPFLVESKGRWRITQLSEGDFKDDWEGQSAGGQSVESQQSLKVVTAARLAITVDEENFKKWIKDEIHLILKQKHYPAQRVILKRLEVKGGPNIVQIGYLNDENEATSAANISIQDYDFLVTEESYLSGNDQRGGDTHLTGRESSLFHIYSRRYETPDEQIQSIRDSLLVLRERFLGLEEVPLRAFPQTMFIRSVQTSTDFKIEFNGDNGEWSVRWKIRLQNGEDASLLIGWSMGEGFYFDPIKMSLVSGGRQRQLLRSQNPLQSISVEDRIVILNFNDDSGIENFLLQVEREMGEYLLRRLPVSVGAERRDIPLAVQMEVIKKGTGARMAVVMEPEVAEERGLGSAEEQFKILTQQAEAIELQAHRAQPGEARGRFYEKALEMRREAHNILPGNESGRADLGKAYFHDKNYEKAIEILKPLIAVMENRGANGHDQGEYYKTLHNAMDTLGYTYLEKVRSGLEEIKSEVALSNEKQGVNDKVSSLKNINWVYLNQAETYFKKVRTHANGHGHGLGRAISGLSLVYQRRSDIARALVGVTSAVLFDGRDARVEALRYALTAFGEADTAFGLAVGDGKIHAKSIQESPATVFQEALNLFIQGRECSPDVLEKVKELLKKHEVMLNKLFSNGYQSPDGSVRHTLGEVRRGLIKREDDIHIVAEGIVRLSQEKKSMEDVWGGLKEEFVESGQLTQDALNALRKWWGLDETDKKLIKQYAEFRAAEWADMLGDALIEVALGDDRASKEEWVKKKFKTRQYKFLFGEVNIKFNQKETLEIVTDAVVPTSPTDEERSQEPYAVHDVEHIAKIEDPNYFNKVMRLSDAVLPWIELMDTGKIKATEYRESLDGIKRLVTEFARQAGILESQSSNKESGSLRQAMKTARIGKKGYLQCLKGLEKVLAKQVQRIIGAVKEGRAEIERYKEDVRGLRERFQLDGLEVSLVALENCHKALSETIPPEPNWQLGSRDVAKLDLQPKHLSKVEHDRILSEARSLYEKTASLRANREVLVRMHDTLKSIREKIQKFTTSRYVFPTFSVWTETGEGAEGLSLRFGDMLEHLLTSGEDDWFVGVADQWFRDATSFEKKLDRWIDAVQMLEAEEKKVEDIIHRVELIIPVAPKALAKKAREKLAELKKDIAEVATTGESLVANQSSFLEKMKGLHHQLVGILDDEAMKKILKLLEKNHGRGLKGRAYLGDKFFEHFQKKWGLLEIRFQGIDLNFESLSKFIKISEVMTQVDEEWTQIENKLKIISEMLGKLDGFLTQIESYDFVPEPFKAGIKNQLGGLRGRFEGLSPRDGFRQDIDALLEDAQQLKDRLGRADKIFTSHQRLSLKILENFKLREDLEEKAHTEDALMGELHSKNEDHPILKINPLLDVLKQSVINLGSADVDIDDQLAKHEKVVTDTEKKFGDLMNRFISDSQLRRNYIAGQVKIGLRMLQIVQKELEVGGKFEEGGLGDAFIEATSKVGAIDCLEVVISFLSPKSQEWSHPLILARRMDTGVVAEKVKGVWGGLIGATNTIRHVFTQMQTFREYYDRYRSTVQEFMKEQGVSDVKNVQVIFGPTFVFDKGYPKSFEFRININGKELDEKTTQRALDFLKSEHEELAFLTSRFDSMGSGGIDFLPWETVFDFLIYMSKYYLISGADIYSTISVDIDTIYEAFVSASNVKEESKSIETDEQRALYKIICKAGGREEKAAVLGKNTKLVQHVIDVFLRESITNYRGQRFNVSLSLAGGDGHDAGSKNPVQANQSSAARLASTRRGTAPQAWRRSLWEITAALQERGKSGERFWFFIERRLGGRFSNVGVSIKDGGGGVSVSSARMRLGAAIAKQRFKARAERRAEEAHVRLQASQLLARGQKIFSRALAIFNQAKAFTAVSFDGPLLHIVDLDVLMAGNPEEYLSGLRESFSDLLTRRNAALEEGATKRDYYQFVSVDSERLKRFALSDDGVSTVLAGEGLKAVYWGNGRDMSMAEERVSRLREELGIENIGFAPIHPSVVQSGQGASYPIEAWAAFTSLIQRLDAEGGAMTSVGSALSTIFGEMTESPHFTGTLSREQVRSLQTFDPKAQPVYETWALRPLVVELRIFLEAMHLRRQTDRAA